MASCETKISNKAEVKGDVSFGFGCMIHPYAKIIAEEGSKIVFGEYNIIEEGVLIKAGKKINPKTKKEENSEINIGNYNHFKIGSHVENTIVKDYNIIDYRAKIVNSEIDSKTIMAPLSELIDGKILKDNAIILPQNKLGFNHFFDQKIFEDNIKNLVGILEHQFKSAESRK